MTANSIVMKLNALLADPIDSECRAVYLLCEARKLLEPVPAPQRPFALNMYCHWALHIDLHGRDTITPFLQRVDEFVHGKLVGPEDFGADNQMVHEFLMFETLRSQFRDFCQSKGIRTDLTDDGARWNEFVRHYAGVIEDGSLSILAPNHGMKHVKKVTFIKGRDTFGEFAQIPFDMVWRITLLDGRRIDVDVNARPPMKGTGQMVASGVRLHV
jgi:hypothetical protein